MNISAKIADARGLDVVDIDAGDCLALVRYSRDQ
jgi:hypothetical protein